MWDCCESLPKRRWGFETLRSSNLLFRVERAKLIEFKYKFGKYVSMTQSSLYRYRLAILAVTALAAGCSIYYIREHVFLDRSPRQTLRRSNAIHRRRNQRTRLESVEPTAGQPTSSDTVAGEENEESGTNAETDEPQKDGSRLMNLVYCISEDQWRKSGYVHQVSCNGCHNHPIRGIRYRCANCADYDLCEQCESMQVHTPTHVFYKVRIPAPIPLLGNPQRPQPVWYPGKPAGLIRQLSRDQIQLLCGDTKLDDSEIAALWDQFRCLASQPDNDDLFGMSIDLSTFDRCFMPNASSRFPRPNLIYHMMFSFYDTDRDGLIGFVEFIKGLACIRAKEGRLYHEKLRRIFNGYDIDRDGLVSRKDFLRMFRAYYALMKEIHSELIVRMEEEASVNSQSAREIVASSRPLSSAFGGPNHRGQPSRIGEGKLPDRFGDLILPLGQEITRDGRDGIGDHHEAVGDIAEIGRFGNVARPFIRLRGRNGSLPGTPDTIAGAYNLGDRMFDEQESSHDSDVSEFSPNDERHFSGPSEIPSHSDNTQLDSTAEAERQWTDNSWPPSWIEPSDVEKALDQNTPPTDITNSIERFKVAEAAIKRITREDRALRQSVRTEGIYNRWSCRDLYLDEEDGATPPEGYKDGLHVPANAETIAGSANGYGIMNGHSRASRRSRSSSKVRFQDDVTEGPPASRSRSSTSVSSRSIPVGERWGGFEIPEPEKDVGREVLYQVTHEALNEMLNPVFKYREDLAMAVIQTRSQRAHSRSRWQNVYDSIPGLEEFISAELHELLRQWQMLPQPGPQQAKIQASEFLQYLQDVLRDETLSGKPANRFFLNMCKAFGMSETHASFQGVSLSMPSQTPMSVPDAESRREDDQDSEATDKSESGRTYLHQESDVSSPPAYQDDPDIVYPEAALELQAAVSTFDQMDPSQIEADISSKSLSELLAESNYTADTSSPPVAPPEPGGSVLSDTNSAPLDPTLPQNRPNPSNIEKSFLANLKPRPQRLPEESLPPHTIKYYAFLDCIEKEDRQRGGPGRMNFEEFERIMSAKGASLSFLEAWGDLASF